MRWLLELLLCVSKSNLNSVCLRIARVWILYTIERYRERQQRKMVKWNDRAILYESCWLMNVSSVHWTCECDDDDWSVTATYFFFFGIYSLYIYLFGYMYSVDILPRCFIFSLLHTLCVFIMWLERVWLDVAPSSVSLASRTNTWDSCRLIIWDSFFFFY